MKKYRNKIFSLLLVVALVIGIIPITSITAKAWGGGYISNIGVAAKGSASGAQSILTKNGYSLIIKDLNKKAGGDYVYVGYKTTYNWKDAITGIIVRVGKNPPETTTYKNCTFYLVGGSSEANVSDQGKVDLNSGAGGEYLYIYVTRDKNYGSPITSLAVDTNKTYNSGHTVTDGDGNDKCVNSKGASDGYGYYMSYRTFQDEDAAKLDVLISYADGGNILSVQKSYTVKNPDEKFYPNVSVLSEIGYTKMTLKLQGWNSVKDTDFDNADYSITSKELCVSAGNRTKSTLIRMQAIYESEVTLTYNSDGGDYTPAPQTDKIRVKALFGQDSMVMEELYEFKIPDRIPKKNGVCNFKGWTAGSSSLFQPGETINTYGNSTLTAVYGEHDFAYSVSGNVVTETCKNGCGHKETATLKVKDGADLKYTGQEIKPLEVVYSSGWKGVKNTDILYDNNINIGSNAYGYINICGMMATQFFTITKGNMANVTADDVSVAYDGNAHGIVVKNVPSGAKVTYSTNGVTYSTVNPTFTEVGENTVYYRVEKAGFETVNGSAKVTVSKATNAWIVSPSIQNRTYGETAYEPNKGAVKYGTVKVEYKLEDAPDSQYSTTVPLDAGSYIARFSVDSGKNYNGLSREIKFDIYRKNIELTSDSIEKVYGETDPEFTYKVTDGTLVGSDKLTGITITRQQGENVGDYKINVSQVKGANPNYNITFKSDGYLTISKKTIGISWGNTQLTYNGTVQAPTATATGTVGNDKIELVVSGGKTNAGTRYIATVTEIKGSNNYKLPKNAITEFSIAKAEQTAPSGLVGTDETVDGKADGKISGVTSAMEYCKDGESTYTAIADTEIINLEDGTYYVRFKATDNYNASSTTKVVIGKGRKLKVTVPETQVGYTVSVNKEELAWNESFDVTFKLKDGYSRLDTFALNVNGVPAELDGNGKCTVSNVKDDISVTVTGVADITAPETEITLGESKWNKFWNNVTFGLFFKDTQKVTVASNDKGSGINKVYYFLSESALNEEEVKKLDESKWTEYKSAFNLNPQDEYIIYVKATDKVGNTRYISSEYGIIIDSIAPVVTGIANGETHYGDTSFMVTEKYIDEVTVDGTPLTLTKDNKYTLKADGKEHTIAVTDKAGNASATIKITVIAISSIDDKIEGITSDNVKSSDKKDIQDVLDLANSLINSGKDFTDNEDKELEDIKKNAENLLKKIDEIGDLTLNLTESVNGYDIDSVTSEDKNPILGIIATIDGLLEGDNLTEPERDAMESLKEKAENLIKRIDDAKESSKTENTDKVKDVTEDNVKTDDKKDLENAKNDLENTLDDYKDNLTDKEKEDIREELDRINDALDKIDKVEKVEDLINNIPNRITKDDEDTIKKADEAYNGLSEYEQSILDKDAKKKLDNAKSSLEELKNPSISPSTGDSNSIRLWLILITFTCGLLALCIKKKREF